jgi:hypothetical protein
LIFIVIIWFKYYYPTNNVLPFIFKKAMPFPLQPKQCNVAFLMENIGEVLFPKVMPCDVCQNNHPVVYSYRWEENDQGFNCVEQRHCTRWFSQTNNRTGAELIYTVDELVANLRRQLENGVEVLYIPNFPH